MALTTTMMITMIIVLIVIAVRSLKAMKIII